MTQSSMVFMPVLTALERAIALIGDPSFFGSHLLANTFFAHNMHRDPRGEAPVAQCRPKWSGGQFEFVGSRLRKRLPS